MNIFVQFDGFRHLDQIIDDLEGRLENMEDDQTMDQASAETFRAAIDQLSLFRENPPQGVPLVVSDDDTPEAVLLEIILSVQNVKDCDFGDDEDE
jgi:hypothetical protein